MRNFDPRKCRQIEGIWKLGPRVVAELLEEVSNPLDLDIALARYARLDEATVKALGGDKFPPQPLYEVPE